MENENIEMVENETVDITENEETTDVGDTSVIIETEENTDVATETVTEYVYIKENRPFFETPLIDYSVTEGLLLLIFVVTVLNSIFKSHIKG